MHNFKMKIFIILLALVLICSCASGRGRHSKLSNGKEASQGDFPYIVSIKHEVGGVLSHVCGGTILNDNHVLTAAQCLEPYTAGSLHAVAGEQDLSVVSIYEEDRTGKHKEFEDYSALSGVNDIAILRVSHNFVFIEGYVEKVVLPDNYAEPQVGTICAVIGWGSLDSSQLKFASMNYINDQDCQVYSATEVFSDFVCGESILGTNTCDGDIGGPFMCNGQQHGVITSASCDDSAVIATQVSHYIDWINLHYNS